MSKNTYLGANVITTDTFSGWIDKTNQVRDDMGTIVVTVTTSANAEPNTSNAGLTTGNLAIQGVVTANTIAVSSALRGGTVTTPGNLTVSSNVLFTTTGNVEFTTANNINVDANNLILSSNVIFDGGATKNIRIDTANTTVNSGAFFVNSNTVFSSNVTMSGTSATFTANLIVSDRIVHSGDTDTAIRFPTADTVTVETGGVERMRLTSSQVTFPVSTGNLGIEVGSGRSGDGAAFIDLIGDTTYTDYGLRVSRESGGSNTVSRISHRGTGGFEFIAQDAASLRLYTTNLERMRVGANGNVGIGNTAPAATLTVDGTIGGTIIASQAEAEAGTDATKLMTPLRVAQAVADQSDKLLASWTYSTNVTSIAFTGLSGWKNIKVVFSFLISSGDQNYIELSTDNGSTYVTTNYSSVTRNFANGLNTSTSRFNLTRGAGGKSMMGNIILNNFGDTNEKTYTSVLRTESDEISVSAGGHNTIGSCNAFRVAGGTFSAGKIFVYGETKV